MGSKIGPVERDLILDATRKEESPVMLHAPGRSWECRIAGVDAVAIAFGKAQELPPSFLPGERITTRISHKGQEFAFDSTLHKSMGHLISLKKPEALWRGLERRWPRLASPKGLRVDLLLPDAAVPAHFPKSEVFRDPGQPGESGGLDLSNLEALVTSFRKKAETLSSGAALRMLREDSSPPSCAEEIAGLLGRMLFVPSTLGNPFPVMTPYADDRLIVRDMLQSRQWLTSGEHAARFADFLHDLAEEGTASFIISPVVYNCSVIGFVHLHNGAERARPLERAALDLAWSFSRHFASFLKRHGYYRDQEGFKAERAEVLDATPVGLRVSLGAHSPRLDLGARFDLRLAFPKGELSCMGLIARHYEIDGRNQYGLALEGLPLKTVNALARGYYGRPELAIAAGEQASGY